MFDSILDVLQIVVTLEIYDVTIVGIPFGYRGFSDEELTEVPVISRFPPCWFLVEISFDLRSIVESDELFFLLMNVYNIGISFAAVKESGSEYSSFRWKKPIGSFTWRTWSQWNCGQFEGGLLMHSIDKIHDFAEKSLFFYSGYYIYCHLFDVQVMDFRKEGSTCSLCWVEMAHMLVQMQFTMRLLILYLCINWSHSVGSFCDQLMKYIYFVFAWIKFQIKYKKENVSLWNSSFIISPQT